MLYNTLLVAASNPGSLITEGLKTAFSNAVATIMTDVSSFMSIALPAALTIMGGILAIKLGIRFFRSVVN